MISAAYTCLTGWSRRRARALAGTTAGGHTAKWPSGSAVVHSRPTTKSSPLRQLPRQCNVGAELSSGPDSQPKSPSIQLWLVEGEKRLDGVDVDWLHQMMLEPSASRTRSFRRDSS